MKKKLFLCIQWNYDTAIKNIMERLIEEIFKNRETSDRTSLDLYFGIFQDETQVE